MIDPYADADHWARDTNDWFDMEGQISTLPRSKLTWDECVAISDDNWRRVFLAQRQQSRARHNPAYNEPSSWDVTQAALHELEQELSFKAICTRLFTVYYNGKGGWVPVEEAQRRIIAPIRTIACNTIEIIVHEACHIMIASNRDLTRPNYDLQNWMYRGCHQVPLEWFNYAGLADSNGAAYQAVHARYPDDEMGEKVTQAHYKELLAIALENEVYLKAYPRHEIERHTKAEFFHALHAGYLTFGGNESINNDLLESTELWDMPDAIRTPVEKALTKHAKAVDACARLIGHAIDWGTLEGFPDTLRAMIK